MQKDTTHSTVTNYEEKNIVHKTKYRFAEGDRYIFSICKQPHLVATICNNLPHSGFNKIFSRLLGDGNCYFSHVKDIILDDLELGPQLCPKITTKHMNLTPFSLGNYC